MASSCHPKHVTKNLPVGELVRMKWNSTSPETYTKAKEETCFRLHHRAYPQCSLNRVYNIVDKIPRNALLDTSNSFKKQKNWDKFGNSSKITFSTGFIPQYRQVVGIVKKHLPHLNSDPNLRHILSSEIRFVSRKAPTLGSKISPSFFSSKTGQQTTCWQTVGPHKCGHNKCLTYNHVVRTSYFISVANGRTFEIHSHINCNMKNVMYLAECRALQIWRHLSDARKPLGFSASNISNLSRHFATIHQGDTTNFTVTGIEIVKKSPRGSDLRKHLLSLEARWIFNLETRTPPGLNLISTALIVLSQIYSVSSCSILYIGL